MHLGTQKVKGESTFMEKQMTFGKIIGSLEEHMGDKNGVLIVSIWLWC